MNNFNQKNTFCPACGFTLGSLDFKYYGGESCPCCCIEFQYDDNPLASGVTGTKEEIYATWRDNWIRGGMKFKCGEPPPNWNPVEQLKNIGIDVED